MPWCPKCRRFQEEDDLCAYCWVELVDTLPEVAKMRDGNEVLLICLGDQNEANIIQSLLESNGIYSLQKHPGSGGYMRVYMGTTSSGIEIYVLDSDLEAAREIIQADFGTEEDCSFEDYQDNNVVEELPKRYHNARVLLALILSLSFFGVILGLMGVIRFS